MTSVITFLIIFSWPILGVWGVVGLWSRDFGYGVGRERICSAFDSRGEFVSLVFFGAIMGWVMFCINVYKWLYANSKLAAWFSKPLCTEKTDDKP